MFKKSSNDVKKYIKLSINFSRFFRENFIQNHAKIMKNGSVHKHCQRTHFWSALCSHGSNFSLIFGCPGSSRDVPATSQKAPIFQWIFGRLRKSAQVGPWDAPGRLQGGPRRPPGTSSAAFCVDFGSIFRVDFHARYFGDLLNFCMKCLLLFVWTFCSCAWLWLGRPRNSIKHK